MISRSYAHEGSEVSGRVKVARDVAEFALRLVSNRVHLNAPATEGMKRLLVVEHPESRCTAPSARKVSSCYAKLS